MRRPADSGRRGWPPRRWVVVLVIAAGIVVALFAIVAIDFAIHIPPQD